MIKLETKVVRQEISIELQTTLALHNNVKSRNGRRYGFGVYDIHIHAYRFMVSGDSTLIDLYDKDGYKIAQLKTIYVKELTICGTDYWNVFTTLYYKGVSD